MTVIFSKPYEFVPPDYGNIWPFFIQRLRLVDRYLKKKEGIVNCECRGLNNFRASIDGGDGILLAPNHCRYGDPLVLGWPARILDIHVFAMASWHLFNQGRLDAFAIQKCGAFSIHREGTDRKSLETAINILADAARPLVVFPEGTTSRMNDYLMPLLEGVTFVARAAARRRAKKSGGRVVVLPVAIKYLCETEMEPWANEQLNKMESRIGWHPRSDQSILDRTIRVSEALVSLKEIEHLGQTQPGDLAARRDALIRQLLSETEKRLGIEVTCETPHGERIRQIRTEAVARFFDNDTADSEKANVRRDVRAADVALQLLLTYPERYLRPESVTDTRIVETIQRMQESFGGKADVSIPLKVVIEFDEAIEVPAAKAPRHQEDPVLVTLAERLTEMLERLSGEAKPLRS